MRRVPRPQEEELAVVMRELGFSRRGAKIVAAIEVAQARAGGLRPTASDRDR